MKKTWNELDKAVQRRTELAYETEGHRGCTCTLCLEYLHLDAMLGNSDEDQKASAVIAINEGRGAELVESEVSELNSHYAQSMQ